MDEREGRAREIQDRIGRILYEEWDPLGLRGVAPSDEYDSYVGGVYRLLAVGADGEQVAEHLAELERGPFGYLEATAARNMAAARKLCELDVRLSRRGETYEFHVLWGTLFVITPYRDHTSRRHNPTQQLVELHSPGELVRALLRLRLPVTKLDHRRPC